MFKGLSIAGSRSLYNTLVECVGCFILALFKVNMDSPLLLYDPVLPNMLDLKILGFLVLLCQGSHVSCPLYHVFIINMCGTCHHELG